MSKHKSLWSLIRAVLTQGGAIEMDRFHGQFESSEHFHARLDEAAREREAAFHELIQPVDAELLAMVRRYASECANCKGSGQICTGYSGRDSDGNAPILERCEDCMDIHQLIGKAGG